jgi:hypothetical protein
MIEGRLTVAPGNLGRLDFAHGTLLPGHGGLRVESGGNAGLVLRIERAICESVAVADPLAGLTVVDSILGGEGAPSLSLDAPQAAAELRRSTVFGGVSVQALNATDCVFAGPLRAERHQIGCVRFSFVPPGSAAPRRYRCQPELETATRLAALREAARLAGRTTTAAGEAALGAEVEALIRPLFVSRRLGDPGFGQIEARCAVQIRTGAESGAEMGAFEFLKQPQREANLRDALAEYLPLGLEAGLFFVN